MGVRRWGQHGETHLPHAEGTFRGAWNISYYSWVPGTSMDPKHCKLFKRFGELSWTGGYSPSLKRVGLVKKSLAKQKGFSSLKIVMGFFVFSIQQTFLGRWSHVPVLRHRGSFMSSHVRLSSQTSVCQHQELLVEDLKDRAVFARFNTHSRDPSGFPL